MEQATCQWARRRASPAIYHSGAKWFARTALASNSSLRQRSSEMCFKVERRAVVWPTRWQAMIARPKEEVHAQRDHDRDRADGGVLTEESHECLMAHVSESSSAFNPLQTAIHLHGYGTTPAHAVVKCDLAAATELLAVAEQHCKAAVHDIKIAIKEPDA
jgi:hypothetical protein